MIKANLRAALLNKESLIALGALAGVSVHLVIRILLPESRTLSLLPLYAILIFGGAPLVIELTQKLFRREFSSDLLAGISIATSVLLGEYLAGCFVVLMLSGGGALERYAVRRASRVLEALAKRMPNVAHKKDQARIVDLTLDAIEIGDLLVIFPHEVCPVDGVVTEGHSVMDESYLTGEPFEISKTPGSEVLSGSINGDSALTIKANKKAIDSRYAKIMDVMRASEERRPKIRRLGDQLGALYTPLAVILALAAWAISGEAIRFLAVLIIATPCPLLIAIPVSIIGAISLAAQRGIIIKDPAVLEQIDSCRTIIFDKTGTLTYGEPQLTEITVAEGVEEDLVLRYAASLEQYSKHPLAASILAAADSRRLHLGVAESISEPPGAGLRGKIEGREILVSSMKKLREAEVVGLPPESGEQGGLHCAIAVDKKYVATFLFHDRPRGDSGAFVGHLGVKHAFEKIMLLSGDRESEVRYLADQVGIPEVYSSKSPEEKVEIVRAETSRAKTIFVGDGINDAPALLAATVGVAFGQNSDITSEAAGAVIMEASLKRVDELFHISRRMRRIALESAVGGMALSVVGMLIAGFGYLPPVGGAIAQEIIDLLAVLNALRVAFPVQDLADY